MDMPFERMAKAVDRLAEHVSEDVIVQTGWTNYAYQHVKKSFSMCTRDEMHDYIHGAELLIMQGGWGAISEAMDMHKRMVVVPRFNETEHIHDQFQLVRKLDEIGVVVGVLPTSADGDETFRELQKAVGKARTHTFKQIEKGSSVAAIRSAIDEMKCGKRICLASSAGGHLRELQLAVGDIPDNKDCYWLTLKTTATKAFMADKKHVFLVNFQPAKKWTLIANAIQALWWVVMKRPTCIITTGAGVCIPTIAFAKRLLGTKIIFINSAADVTTPSRTPVWIEKYADLFLVQWSDMLKCFPNAICCGVL